MGGRSGGILQYCLGMDEFSGKKISFSLLDKARELSFPSRNKDAEMLRDLVYMGGLWEVRDMGMLVVCQIDWQDLFRWVLKKVGANRLGEKQLMTGSVIPILKIYLLTVTNLETHQRDELFTIH